MPIDDKGKCQPCSTNDCEICNGSKNDNICSRCKSSFVLTNDRVCVPYSFEAKYYIDGNSLQISLISEATKKYIKELVIDGDKKNSPSTFKFEIPGEYLVHIFIDMPDDLRDLSEMFYKKPITQISFTSQFDTSNIESFFQMFSECKLLTHINISTFDTSKVTNIYKMFSDCPKLKSVILSNFNNKKLQYLNFMFYN